MSPNNLVLIVANHKAAYMPNSAQPGNAWKFSGHPPSQEPDYAYRFTTGRLRRVRLCAFAWKHAHWQVHAKSYTATKPLTDNPSTRSVRSGESHSPSARRMSTRTSCRRRP